MIYSHETPQLQDVNDSVQGLKEDQGLPVEQGER